MMLPAHLEGPPWHDLALIYGKQYGFYYSLAMGAPNLYMIVQAAHLHHPGIVRLFGLLVTCIFCAWLIPSISAPPPCAPAPASCCSRPPPSSPFRIFLPRMHDRYFFTGDCLLVILAMRRSSLGWLAALMQVAMIFVYKPFLSGHIPRLNELLFSILIVSLCIFVLVRDLYRVAAPPPTSPAPLPTSSPAFSSQPPHSKPSAQPTKRSTPHPPFNIPPAQNW